MFRGVAHGFGIRGGYFNHFNQHFKKAAKGIPTLRQMSPTLAACGCLSLRHPTATMGRIGQLDEICKALSYQLDNHHSKRILNRLSQQQLHQHQLHRHQLHQHQLRQFDFKVV